MITTLTGSNSFLLKRELDAYIKAFVAEHSDIGLERLDGEEAEFDRINEALISLPFLATKKLVVLRSPSARKQFTEKIEDLLAGVPETVDVIIIEPKLDKRSGYFKTLKAKTEFKEFNELEGHSLAQWLVDEVKKVDGKLSLNDARYLVERVGANQQLLSNELQKLLAYNAGVRHETIDLLTDKTPQSTVFELLEAAFSGNTKRALELYDEQRRLMVEPLQIVALLGWQLHQVALVKTAGATSVDEIARQTKLSPYSLNKSKRIADKLTFAQVKQLVREALELDVRMKSESIDSDEALKFFIVSLKFKKEHA